ARGLVAAFDAAPLPRGLVELDMPAGVRAGSVWRVDGRVEAVADGRVELRDPSGAVVAVQALDKQGRFALHASAKVEGTALFVLHVLDRDGAQADTATVPLSVRAGSPLKIVLLAGAPDAELKYLRRWAADAGLALTSRIALSDGVALTEGAAALDDAALRTADIAIVDERAWAALAAPRRQALIAAVHDGLGLLLRATGPLPAPVAADWADLGFRVQAADAPPPVALDRTLGLADSGLAFSRQALAVEAGDAAPLLRADDGSTLAWLRDLGHGRVALWLLADSYRLALGGAAPAYGTLWGDALAAVARARGGRDPSLPQSVRVDERVVFCGIAADAAIGDAAGTRLPLNVDARGCAAYWPATPGWQALLGGDQRRPFYVRARDEAVGLAAQDRLRATRALLGASVSTAVSATRGQPLPRWPFFLAWLVAAAALWRLERGAAAGSGGATDD
ncbi:carboxypeptidase regulatory-like domain-containing protein, partial [Rudaea sp.]|uniref:carboxypeptidase regulatory-like domain-containing protein n=1 Tax=Rudaea sp. TaxID=2136325 RepID=UPI00321FD5AF